MRIVDFLRPEAVIADRSGQTAADHMADLSRPLGARVDTPNLVRALLDREKLGSTGIGDGVAIPHARIAGLPDIIACFGRSRAGVEFGAIDAKPVHFFFAVLVPEESPGVRIVEVQVGGVYVKLLARISLLFQKPAFREAVLRAQDAAEIHRLISEEDATEAG